MVWGALVQIPLPKQSGGLLLRDIGVVSPAEIVHFAAFLMSFVAQIPRFLLSIKSFQIYVFVT